MIKKIIGIGVVLTLGVRFINPWLLKHFTRPVLLRQRPLRIKYTYN